MEHPPLHHRRAGAILARYAVAFIVGVVSVAGVARSEPSESDAPARYRFVAGDVIEITVSSHTGHDRIAKIQPDGRIQYPLVGEIVAAGLTAPELAARLREGLVQELVDPQVSVSLKEARPEAAVRVSVLGAVRSQGSYTLKEKSTLVELLAIAGGPDPLADLSRITITRADRSQVETVDLSRITASGQVGGDVVLREGDRVVVPAGAPPTLQVQGEVVKPGSYDFQGERRVMDVIGQAGGPTPKADLAHVQLHRGGLTQVLDLRAVALGAAPANSDANPVVRPDDVIRLAEDANRALLLGEFLKPDSYPLREGDRVFDLITRAGGPGASADLKKAVLLRRDAQGQVAAQPLDLRALLTKGDVRQNWPLQPGDVIVLPPRETRGSGGRSFGQVLLPTLLGFFFGVR
jgi:polysaccharide export outer membrane protein